MKGSTKLWIATAIYLIAKYRYKLIKEYPGSPKLGTIMEKWAEAFYVCVSHTSYAINTEQVENYPDFWARLYPIADGEVTENDVVYAILPENDPNKKYGVEYKKDIFSVLNKRYLQNEIYSNLDNLQKELTKRKEKKDLDYYTIKADKLLRSRGIDHGYFKEHMAKYYWMYVLELISHDLNEGWIPNWSDDTMKYWIVVEDKAYTYDSCSDFNYFGAFIFFKSKEAVIRAINLIGDKNLDKIFK